MYSIIGIDCPQCRKTIWVNNGDVSDLTVGDIDAIKCCFCNHEFYTDGCSDKVSNSYLIEDSFETPNKTIGL